MAVELKGLVSFDTSSIPRATEAVRAFENNLRSAFKRTGGDLPAKKALEDFARYAGSGDVTGAIQGLVSRLGGLGIAGGAAIGALTAGLVAGRKQLADFEEGLGSMEKILARMPEAGAGLGAVRKHVDELFSSLSKEAKPGIAGMITSAIGDVGGGAGTERREARAARDHDEQINQIVRSLGMEAAATRAVTKEQEKELELAQRIAEIRATQKERLTEVTKKRLEPAEAQKLYGAINQGAREQEENAKAAAEKEARAAQMKRAAPIIERSQLSSKELRSGQGLLSDRLQLQQADMHEKLGEGFRGQGFRGLAAESFGRSEGIKGEISGLRESEKQAEYQFQEALDGSSRLAEIAGTLSQILGKGAISFENK